MKPGNTQLRIITEELRRTALRLGFSHIGFSPIDELSENRRLLDEWMKRGYQAGMHWMQRTADKRGDPRFILPEARSVISVAMNYYSPQQHSAQADKGKISRYAWGDEYHDILDKHLSELEKIIHELLPDIKTRRYVDTGPIMEKAWAVRAGIGWLGKNGVVITRDLGSWIFLGEILASSEFVYDSAIADYCGSCTQCIEACPTQAIVQPSVIDSRRCISWLTIECRDDELPLQKNMNLDRWVFGCDVCQDVCPWNSFAHTSDQAAFQPRDGNVAPPLRDLASISDEEFREKFRRSPVKRCKPVGMRRNARTVLNQHASNIDQE